MHRTDGRLYISSLPNVSFSLSLSLSLPLFLFHTHSLSVRYTCSPSKTASGPIGEVTVRLWLSREFSEFLRAFSQSVASRHGIRFLVHSMCTPLLVFRSLGDTVTHHRIAHLSLSFCLFIYLYVSCLHSCKRCQDLMLCGSDVFHPSRNTTRINRALICRYAWSTCVRTHVRG